MRCHSIRSVLRASLVAGLLASCQNAAFSASWKDCLHPFAGTCFIHDLQWEQFNSQTNRGDYSSKSILTSDSEIIETSDRESDICVAAAEQFEFRMQVDKVFDALRSQSNQFSEAGTKIFQSYSRSRRMLISSIDSQSLKLVEWINVANSFPPRVVESQGNQDFECGWDCGEWSRHVPHSVSNILPYRDCANVFVYSLDASTESLDSDNIPVTIVASSEYDETPIGPDQFNAENGLVSDAELTASVSNIVAPASDCSPSDSDTDHARQVGVDPVCLEVQLRNHSWSGCLVQPSICCPQDTDPEAVYREHIASPTVISIRPPTLEAEYETQVVVTPFEFEEKSVFEYGNHWVNSLRSASWFSGTGKRFAFGDSAPRMPQAGPPIATFSKEDLAVASKFTSDILAIEIEKLDKVAEPNGMPFSSKDFLTTLHASAYGSIMVPVSTSHRLAVDYAMKVISPPSTEAKSQMSKGVASQIRTVGQFLVDFANQIESRIEQVEIARRDNIQR